MGSQSCGYDIIHNLPQRVISEKSTLKLSLTPIQAPNPPKSWMKAFGWFKIIKCKSWFFDAFGIDIIFDNSVPCSWNSLCNFLGLKIQFCFSCHLSQKSSQHEDRPRNFLKKQWLCRTREFDVGFRISNQKSSIALQFWFGPKPTTGEFCARIRARKDGFNFRVDFHQRLTQDGLLWNV